MAVKEWQNDCGTMSTPIHGIRSSNTCCNCWYR